VRDRSEQSRINITIIKKKKPYPHDRALSVCKGYNFNKIINILFCSVVIITTQIKKCLFNSLEKEYLSIFKYLRTIYHIFTTNIWVMHITFHIFKIWISILWVLSYNYYNNILLSVFCIYNIKCGLWPMGMYNTIAQ
jgi:hypothetical protein